MGKSKNEYVTERTCGTCGGSGAKRVLCSLEPGHRCRMCDSSGYMYVPGCRTCGGSGMVRK